MNLHPSDKLLALYAGADTNPHQNTQIRAHLETCSNCRAVVDDFEHLALELQSTVVEPDPADLQAVRSRVLDRLAQPRRVRWQLVYGVAAGLAAAAAGFLTLQPRAQTISPPTFAIDVDLPRAPLVSYELPNLSYVPRRHSEMRAGLRAVSFVTSSDGSGHLRLTTADPNVVILLPLSEVKTNHEN